MSSIRGGILHRPTSKEGRYSQSLERGLAILQAFSPERPWLGIAELAEQLEMSRPTTHRYASTLVALDYLEQGKGRKYRLGMRASDPGRSAVASTAVGSLPSHLLADLRDRSHCTASLAVLDGDHIVYVDRARSALQARGEIASRLGRGSRLPAAGTALGRALLAELDQSELLDAVAVDRDRVRHAGDPAKLHDELAAARRRGYAIADQLRVAGQVCVAAAVRDRSGRAIAAVDVAAAKAEYSNAAVRERLAPLVLESAARMSAHMGFEAERRQEVL